MSAETPGERARDEAGAVPPKEEEIPLAPLEVTPPRAAPPRPREGRTGARIDKPGLTADFDEDADFERDPEVEAALRGARPTPARETPVGGDLRPFIRRGMGDARVIAGLGAGLMIAAMIAAGVLTPTGTGAGAIAALVLLVAYQTLLHAGTGLGALLVGAKMAERPLGEPEVGLARMLLAVAAFQLVRVLLTPTSIWLGVAAAVGVYVALVWGLGRLKGRDLAIVAITHFALWLLVWLGSTLQVAAHAGSVVAGGAAAGGGGTP